MNARLATFVRYDHAVSCAFNRASAAPLSRRVFAAVSRLGDGLFWYALMAALPAIYGAKAWPLVGAMALNGVALTLAYKWLKAKTRRLRPCDAHPDLRRDVAPLDRFSFPSGHTLHAVAFSELIIAVHPEWAWLLAPLFGYADDWPEGRRHKTIRIQFFNSRRHLSAQRCKGAPKTICNTDRRSRYLSL